MTFKHFTEKISCRVVPGPRDRRVWLDEKVVDDETYVTVINNRLVELGEQYDDFVYIEAANLAELSDKILRQLYERGFSTGSLRVVDDGRAGLDYSFLDDEPWVVRRQVMGIAYGDITVEDDYRRNQDHRGNWFSYSELAEKIGKNCASKIASYM